MRNQEHGLNSQEKRKSIKSEPEINHTFKLTDTDFRAGITPILNDVKKK